jgi:leader peptidase (prepilin peptidase)/N-methyltransferase
MAGVQSLMLLWTFVLGCAVGSFLNVVIWRLPRGLTIGRPKRSFCPRCDHVIRWYDNIPLVSYAWLGARCRDCGGSISARYPIVEGLTGLIFALIYLQQGVNQATELGQVIVMMLVASLLIVGSAVDVDWLIIPDEITFFGLVGGAAAGLLVPGLHVGVEPYHTYARLTGMAHLDGLVGSLIGAAAGGLTVLIFAAIGAAMFRREAMGFGDVKLLAMVGAFFGWKVAIVAFFLAPFVGLLYGIPILIASDEHVMPFGPFLSVGSFVALLFRSYFCAYLEPMEYLVRHLL